MRADLLQTKIGRFLNTYVQNEMPVNVALLKVMPQIPLPDSAVFANFFIAQSNLHLSIVGSRADPDVVAEISIVKNFIDQYTMNDSSHCSVIARLVYCNDRWSQHYALGRIRHTDMRHENSILAQSFTVTSTTNMEFESRNLNHAVLTLFLESISQPTHNYMGAIQ